MGFSGFGSGHIQLTTNSCHRIRCKHMLQIRLTVTVLVLGGLSLTLVAVTQDSFPNPPNDLTKIYYLGDKNDPVALPFESGVTPVNVFQQAIADKVTRVRLIKSKAE